MTPDAETEFREFAATRIDRLGRFAYVMCGDWHQAEDAVQRALTKLYLRWHKASIQSPDAYVRRIIVNTLNDDRRLGWFRRERATETPPEQVGDDLSEMRAQRVTVLAALSRLPQRQRAAVVLRHWEDLSVEQSAAIMGCSTGNVKSQTARGLQTLRGLLQEAVVAHAPEGTT